MSIKNLTTDGTKDLDIYVGDVHTTKLYEDCGVFSMNYGVSTSITVDKPCGRISVSGFPTLTAGQWATVYVTYTGYTELNAFCFCQTHIENDDNAWKLILSTFTFADNIFGVTWINNTTASIAAPAINFNYHIIFNQP